MGTKAADRYVVLVLLMLVAMVFVYGRIHDLQRERVDRLESCLSRPTYQVCEKP